MSALKIPTLHLNGSSKDTLVGDAVEASNALHEAEAALARMAPNARDYYPQGNEAFSQARRAFEALQTQLQSVSREINTYIEALEGK